MNKQFDLASVQLNFVLCPSFHGATLLALFLNNHSALSCLGDTYPTRRFDQKCSCGLKVSKCGFWQELLRRVDAERFRDCTEVLPSSPLIVKGDYDRSRRRAIRYGVLGLGLGPGIWTLARRARDDFIDTYSRFHRSVCEMHGTAMLVDGSKDRAKVLFVRSILGRRTRIKVVHVVRDPRSFLDSNYRKNERTLPQVADYWYRTHRDIHLISKPGVGVDYFRLRYEDLIGDPRSSMSHVFEFLGVADEQVTRPPIYPVKHHLIGNKTMFGFDGTTRPNDAWRDRVSADDQSRILALTEPLSKRWGYPDGVD